MAKTRKSTATKPAATAAPVKPAVISVTVTHRHTAREVLYRPDAPFSRLLADAIRQHGLKFATNSSRRLVGEGIAENPGPNTTGAQAGIKPGQILNLQ